MRAIRLHAFRGPDRPVLDELPDLTLGPVPGGYPEQAVTAVEGQLSAVPAHVPAADAVPAVGTGRTAQGAPELEPPTAGDVVLVPSAAGGLGRLLVQAAREHGRLVARVADGGAPPAAARGRPAGRWARWCCAP